jgi:hypothetical protein
MGDSDEKQSSDAGVADKPSLLLGVEVGGEGLRKRELVLVGLAKGLGKALGRSSFK